MIPLLLLACSQAPAPVAEPVLPPPTAEVALAPPADRLGVDVDPAAALPVDQLIAEADQWVGKELTVKGVIREVCQKKGCWHTIGTSNPEVNVMVKDKEYAIFLPADAAGKTVVVKGTFSSEVMPLEEAKHYAEDAGKDPASITVAPKTFLMDAVGVRVM